MGAPALRSEMAAMFQPRNMSELMAMADMVAGSQLVPQGFRNKPGDIVIAIMMGAELGLAPFQALQNISVINGRAAIWGDAMLALILARPECEYVDENESTDAIGVCKVKRKGQPEQVRRFDLNDAKRAGLLSKAGPWQQYTSRMLKLRARAFALRDTFADALRGIHMAEEAMDLPSDEPQQPQTVQVRQEQPATRAGQIKAKIDRKAQAQEPALIEHQAEPEFQIPAIDSIRAELAAATTKPEMEALRAKITDIADPDLKERAALLYKGRVKELKAQSKAATQ